MGLQGQQRAAIWVRFLHQEERLSRCVACISDWLGYLLFIPFPPTLATSGLLAHSLGFLLRASRQFVFLSLGTSGKII